jgi:hypothetical protein
MYNVLRHRYATKEWMPDPMPVVYRHGDSEDIRIRVRFM